MPSIVWASPEDPADPHDPCWDVEPIPFFPEDLPTVEIEPLTPAQLLSTTRLARRWLWVQPPTNEAA